MENQRLSSLHEMVAKKLARVRAEKPKAEPSKTFTLAEVEGFLAAERERCLDVVNVHYVEVIGTPHEELLAEIANRIRSLPPKPIGDE